MSQPNIFHNPETGKNIVLNPRLALMTEHQYDTAMRYSINHASALRAAARQASRADYPLNRRGFDCVPAISTDTAMNLLNYIKREHLAKCPDSGHLTQQEFRFNDRTLFMNLLEALFQGEIDDMILSYFQSEYMVLFCSMIVTYPAPDNPNSFKCISFKWHSDVGPNFHLKMLVHLNDVAEHGGGTSCIELEPTNHFKQVGYVFNDVENRVSDLSGLAKQYDIKYEETRLKPRTGEAIIFQPSNVLHRGVWPELGPRYLINLGLIPFPLHWRKMAEQHFDMVVNNTESAFPELTAAQ